MSAENTFFHLFLATTVLLAGTAHILFRARRLWTISMVDIAIWMVGVYFGLGPWVASLYSEFRLPDIPSDSLFLAYFSIWLFLIGLWLARRTMSRREAVPVEAGNVQILGRVHEAIHNVADVRLVVILAAYLFVIAARLLLATNYGILFAGGHSKMTEMTLPYGFGIARTLSAIVGSGLLIWASTAIWATKEKKVVGIAVLAMEIMFAFTQGRRNLLLFVVTVCLTCFVMRGKLLLRHIIVSGLVVYLLWTFLMPAFFAVRNVIVYRQSENVLVDVVETLSNYISSQSLDKESWEYGRNLASRPLIIGFNVQIIESQDFTPLLWGRATINSFLIAVPRVFLPVIEKPDQSELTIQKHYGLKVIDSGNNWPAVAVADFGLPGTLFYGVLFGGIIIFLEWLAAFISGKLPFIGACFVGIVLGMAFMVEQGPETVWSQARDGFVLLIVGGIGAAFLPRRRPSEPQEAYAV